MKCPSCNKFASLEMQEPEVQSVEIDDFGNISAEVRIVRNAACCGDEMKEATLTLEGSVFEADVVGHKGKGHDFEVEEDGVDMIEEDGSRYQKSYFGASLTVKVTCSCGKMEPITVEMSDKVAASEMEELC